MTPDPSRTKLWSLILTLMAVGECSGTQTVFLSRSEASGALSSRVRRANSFLEELKLGNLERECVEEQCSYEEAREIMSVPEQLEDFWRRYTEVDQCQSAPCQNGATCVSQANAYICICPVNFEGRLCDKEILPVGSFGCLYRNGGCEHFCVEINDAMHHCACAPGYTLHKDNSSCTPSVDFPCGRVQVKPVGPRVVRGDVCPKGHCPWQALLQYDGVYQCGGVILDTQWILTAAHCIWNKDPSLLQVTVGEHIRDKNEGTEQMRKISRVFLHPRYNHSSSDSDLALLRLHRPFTINTFAIPACLPPANASSKSFMRTLNSVRMSTVSGWGRLAASGPPSLILQRLELPRVSQEECKQRSGLALTSNMLCAGFEEGGRDACQGDSGGPLVTLYKSSWFLTGIVSWGRGCARAELYGVYTRVSAFVEWISDIINSN